MNIVIFGTGYVGLVTGACIAHSTPHSVTCIDIDQAKISNLENGIMPIYEPNLQEIVAEGLKSKKLKFTTDLTACINDADCIFIAVGTPPAEDGSADLKYVIKVAEQIGQNLTRQYTTVVVKSTVPVGTCNLVEQTIKSNLTNKVEFAIASNPEFLREGSAVTDFVNPDRIVIGTNKAYATETLRDLYKTIQMPFEYDILTSEMIKYSSNAMLATRISFMNEIAKICQQVGADVSKVADGMGTDARIGPKFLAAGLGYGGSCFPKDVQALSRLAQEFNIDTPILNSVHSVNESMIDYAADLILSMDFENEEEITFNFFGLAFKPNTDDIRESASIKLIELLASKGCKINVYDPIVKSYTSNLNWNKIKVIQDVREFIDLSADAFIIGTDHSCIKEFDFAAAKRNMKAAVIVDTRNMFSYNSPQISGYRYISIGRPENGVF